MEESEQELSPIIFGMALMITDQNADKIAVVNGGIVPQVGKYGTWYYVFSFAEEVPAAIMTLEMFMENYVFTEGEALDHFKPITWRY